MKQQVGVIQNIANIDEQNMKSNSITGNVDLIGKDIYMLIIMSI